MSSFKNPVGPEPGGTYWRRRLLVLLVLVAVVAVVVLIVVRPGSGGADDAAGGPSAETRTPTPTHVQPDDEPCDPAALQVSAVTDATTYGDDDHPQLSLSVTNTGEAACTIDGGTDGQVYTVTSGDDTYWTSTDCQEDPSSQEVLLKAGSTVSTDPITWDRTRSDPDTCDSDDRPAAPADGASYHLSVEIDGVESEESRQFLLE